MTSKTQSQQEITAQLADLTEQMQREQVKLTPEISAYLKEKVEAVQNKLLNGKPIYPKDMEFVGKIKLWLILPESIRLEYPTIELMVECKEIKEWKGYLEKEMIDGLKRFINPKQWEAVKNMLEYWYEDLEKGLSLIDFRFEFRKGRIIAKPDLDLDHETAVSNHLPPLKSLPDNLEIGSLKIAAYEHLKKLPKNLKVKILEINSWENLISLPEGLQVSEKLVIAGCPNFAGLPDKLEVKEVRISGCDGLEELPDNLTCDSLELVCPNLKNLPKNLKVKKLFRLWGCTNLTELPKSFRGQTLIIEECPGITSLPDDIRLNALRLDRDADNNLAVQAQKLKNEGKIMNLFIT